MNVRITNIIRTAILRNEVRRFQLLEIQTNLGVTRTQAKKLLFAFIYHANEDYLQKLAEA